MSQLSLEHALISIWKLKFSSFNWSIWACQCHVCFCLWLLKCMITVYERLIIFIMKNSLEVICDCCCVDVVAAILVHLCDFCWHVLQIKVQRLLHVMFLSSMCEQLCIWHILKCSLILFGLLGFSFCAYTFNAVAAQRHSVWRWTTFLCFALGAHLICPWPFQLRMASSSYLYLSGHYFALWLSLLKQ